MCVSLLVGRIPFYFILCACLGKHNRLAIFNPSCVQENSTTMRDGKIIERLVIDSFVKGYKKGPHLISQTTILRR